MICDTRFHRRCNAQSLVHAAEIVVHEMKRDGVSQVINLLGESVCEARKAAHLHSHGEILALDKAS